MKNEVVVGVSGRHAHVSQEDLEILFGKGFELTVFKELSQPGQFASGEFVTVINKESGKELANVRILGPVRKATQIEISRSDAIKLKLNPPVRESGDIAGSAGCTLVGPNGEVELKEGVIIASRHIHLSTNEAKEMELNDKEFVKVYVGGEKAGEMHNVLIRVSDDFETDFHIDTDDAAAFGLKTGDKVTIVR